MGLLYGEKFGVYSYNDTKHYQNILRDNAILQIERILRIHSESKKAETESLKFGTEMEIFALNKKIHKN